MCSETSTASTLILMIHFSLSLTSNMFSVIILSTDKGKILRLTVGGIPLTNPPRIQPLLCRDYTQQDVISSTPCTPVHGDCCPLWGSGEQDRQIYALLLFEANSEYLERMNSLLPKHSLPSLLLHQWRKVKKNLTSDFIIKWITVFVTLAYRKRDWSFFDFVWD